MEKAIAVARVRAGKAHAPGAATAPDGILARNEVEPAAPMPEGTVAPEMAVPETTMMQLEQKISVESVFGDAPTKREAT